MKALLLGASGFFGGHILHRLGRNGPIRSVHVASRTLERARHAAENSACPAKPVALEMDDFEALTAAMSEVDIILNAAGNAVETAPRAIRAALTAGKPYVDLSAEVGVLLEAERLFRDFSAPGIPLILGAGIHPGMIELLGVSAARALDTVRAVEMFMIATLQDYGAPERFLPLFEQGWNGIDGLQTLCKLPAMTAVQVRKGTREKILPENALRSFLTLEGEEVDGFAMATCEPLALHRALGGDIDARMTMSYWPPAANAIVREASRGFVEGDTRFAPTLQAMWSTIDAETRRPPAIHFWAIARGTKAGHSASTTAFSRQDWANQQGGAATTAGVAVFAAEAISRGEISRSGVLSPVDLFAPEEVFEALARPQSPDLHVVTSEGL